MTERWIAIEGFEGLYEVSSEGNVRAVDKMQRYLLRTGVEAFRFIPLHAIAYQMNNKGYRIVHLYKENKRQVKTVHRLVAKAFLPNLDNKPEVDHKDRNRNNPRLNNLRWATISENRRRA